jgi:hypothetical protein
MEFELFLSLSDSDIVVVEHCPEGYPRLAGLLDCDEKFMLYRKFGYLQARILLHKQDELRELEKDLDRLDKVDQGKDPSLLKSREKDDVANGRRKKLLYDIEGKFTEYGHLILYSCLVFICMESDHKQRNYSLPHAISQALIGLLLETTRA